MELRCTKYNRMADNWLFSYKEGRFYCTNYTLRR